MSIKRIKIFIFIDSFRVGGMHRQMLFLSKYLNKKIFDTIVCTTGSHGSLKQEYDLTGVQLMDLKWKKTFDIKPVLRLGKILKREVPDIVFITESQNFVYYKIARIFCKKKVINIGSFRALNFWKGHLNVVYKYIDDFLCRWFYTSSNCIIVNSNHLRSHYSKLLKPKQSNPLVVIRNGNDFNFQLSKTNKQLRSELDLKEEDLFLLMVARLDPWKDFDTIIEAAIRSKQIIPSIKLFLVGGGVLENYLKHKIRHLGADSYIKVLGEKVDIYDYINHCDISVLSTNGEGFSNAILESMALGKPVIATDVGGNSEMVGNNGLSGMLMPPKSASKFSEAIIKLGNDLNMRERMGRNGSKRVAQLCSLKKFISSYEHLFINEIKKSKFHSVL